MPTTSTVQIQRLPVHNDADHDHCWVPVVNGRAIEFHGEPPHSVNAAKKAAARELNRPISEIDFQVVR